MVRTVSLRLNVVAAAVAVVLLMPFALLAIFVAGRWAPLRSFDLVVSDAVHVWAVNHPAVVDAMQVWSLVFSPMALRAGALILVVWLFRRHRSRAAWWVIIAMTAGGVVAALLKLVVERDRPSFLDPVARAAGYSFPSGHATNAALTCAVFLAILLPYGRGRRWLWAAAVVVTAVTGLSRIGLGVHFTSDVVAGWLLGAAVVVAMVPVLDRRSTWVRTPRAHSVAGSETGDRPDRDLARRDDRHRSAGDEGAVERLAVHDRGRRQP
ncbi:phosphatase PAP2 family protein [Actinoplanes sp. NPDC051470]|uniref:phosphatase PAP2 family protein n=1 Tax=Actinoplanes sp. NPDC051470 TaxID=3157224 RepID=UPI00341F3E4A